MFDKIFRFEARIVDDKGTDGRITGEIIAVLNLTKDKHRKWVEDNIKQGAWNRNKIWIKEIYIESIIRVG